MIRARRVLTLLALALVTVAVAAVVLSQRGTARGALSTPAADSLHIRGNHIVLGPGPGQVVQLRGINRSGSEYECVDTPGGIFDSPTPEQADSDAMVQEMVNWNINVVRIPLNEGCWLGINAAASHSGAVYRRALENEVGVLNAHHLFVILTLQWNSAGAHFADSPLPMADADHSPQFWRSVALAFKVDGQVMFDLFNEPHGISWSCWQNGCEIPASKFNPYPYRAAGMQQLLDAVRSTGAHQPIILSGTDWSLSLGGYAGHAVRDPDHAVVLAVHSYGGESPCDGGCQSSAFQIASHTPLLYTEVGEVDCASTYLRAKLPLLDARGIGYLAWAWDAVSPGPRGWSCARGPSLIQNFGGTPTPYGAGFRSHLLGLRTPVRP